MSAGANVSKTGQVLLEQMDVTMVPKLSVVSAFLPQRAGARILDVGCGTGAVTYHLARLNPHMTFVGLDYDQSYVGRATEKYKDAPNLSYICENALTFRPEEPFDCTLSQSNFHEISSFNRDAPYTAEPIYAFMRSVADFTAPGGSLIVRDFARAGDEIVRLSLPDIPHDLSGKDGCPEITYPEFLLWYAQNANGQLPEEQHGFWTEEVEPVQPGWRSFHLPRRWAEEFKWRKEYLERRTPESHEQYAILSASDWWNAPLVAGSETLRPEVAMAISNPFMNRPGGWYSGDRILMHDLDGNRLYAGHSNYIIRYRKIEKGQSLRFSEKQVLMEPASYLAARHFVRTDNGKTYDSVARPGGVADVLPYGRDGTGRLVAVIREGYPRPIVNAVPRTLTPNIDGRFLSGHVSEPLAAANLSGTDGETVLDLLVRRSGFDASCIAGLTPGASYFPAPMDSGEHVRSLLVRMMLPGPFERPLNPAQTGFSTAGSIKTVDVQDMLRACRSGAMPEPRLELNGYLLLLAEKMTPDPWFGADFPLAEIENPEIASLDALFLEEQIKDGALRKAFTETGQDSGNLRIVRSLFQEEARDGHKTVIKASRPFEFAVPSRKDAQGRPVSTNSALLLHLVRDKSTGEILADVKVVDSPASQMKDGHSGLITQHGRYLPATVDDPYKLKDFLADSYTLAADDIRPLGESYMPSMGILPGKVYPHLSTGPVPGGRLVLLRDLFANVTRLRDMNLTVSVLRAVHALGKWDEYVDGHRPGVSANIPILQNR